MRRSLYNLLLFLLAPPARWWLTRRPSHQALLARFNPPIPALRNRPVWIQACSLGEVNTSRPLVEQMRAEWPERTLLLTSSTRTGHARAIDLYGPEMVAWFPFDTRRAVQTFIESVRPQILVLVETELWPNVIHECSHGGIPVAVVNGRLGDKHLKKYRRLRWFYRPLVQALAAAGMQSEVHASRMRDLGAPRDVVSVTGNLKFDAVRDHVPAHVRQHLRNDLGLKQDSRLLVFGSTRPGDEALASACWATLREEYPDLKLVIAPRHTERAGKAASFFSEPVRQRSSGNREPGQRDARVIILDTVGELTEFYAAASVAVIGGSFYPGVNGHNPLEPAALGVPVVFGPFMANFEEAAAALVARGGVRQVACPEDLYLAVSELLGDAAARRQIGTRARRTVLDNQGAVRHTMKLIEGALGPTPPRKE